MEQLVSFVSIFRMRGLWKDADYTEYDHQGNS